MFKLLLLFLLSRNCRATARVAQTKTVAAVYDRRMNNATLIERRYNYLRLKYCTAFSCFLAAARVLNVPRFLRFPVFGFFFREYNRYPPDLRFLIIQVSFFHQRRRRRQHVALVNVREFNQFTELG